MSEIKVCSDASGCFQGGLSATNAIHSAKELKGCAIIKAGGTSGQFLKADGSVDTTA